VYLGSFLLKFLTLNLRLGWDGRMPEQRKVKSLLALRDPHEHARRRRPWTRAFNTPALKEYQVVIDKRVSQLVDALSQRIGQNVDLAEWISWFTWVVVSVVWTRLTIYRSDTIS